MIAWKYKLIFNNDMSRASLTAMAGLIVIAIMVSNSADLQRIAKKCELSNRTLLKVNILVILGASGGRWRR